MTKNQTTLETTVPGRPAVPDVLQEHLEELGYLSIQRRKLLFSPEIPLRRLRLHLERIEAHLDGLRVGDTASVSIAQAMLDGDDPWFVSVAARVWMELGQPDTAALRDQLNAVPPELRGAWKEALRQLPATTIQQALPIREAESLSPPALEIAGDAWGWHGLLAPQTTNSLVRSEAAGVRRAIARHANQLEVLARLQEDEDALVRRAALWGLSLQNPRAALERSHQLAGSPQPDPFALRVIGFLGERADGSRLLPFLKEETLAPVAILALRDLAWPEFAEAFLDFSDGDETETTLVARDAFESLVGKMPPANPEQPLPPGISPARFHWPQLRKNLDLSKRRIHGRPFPWSGPASEEPMQWVWRRALTSNASDLAWLRREVPDGFFGGFPSSEAVPGE